MIGMRSAKLVIELNGDKLSMNGTTSDKITLFGMLDLARFLIAGSHSSQIIRPMNEINVDKLLRNGK